MPLRARSRTAGSIAALTAVAVLAPAVPALADAADVGGGRDDGAAAAAAVVERATGTTDIATASSAGGAGAEATTSTPEGPVTVTLPRRADEEVRARTGSGRTFGVGLADAKSAPGIGTGSGTVVYADAAQATDFAVQPTTDGGARLLLTLKDRSAPTTQPFNLNLPEDASLERTEEGGYEITQTDSDGTRATVAEVDAPWAKDANGKPVKTEYKLDGGQLVQTVTPDADTAYPVVADPKVSFGRWIYVRWGRKGVKTVSQRIAGGVAVATAVCSGIPSPQGKAACSAVSGYTLAHLGHVFTKAASRKCKVEVKWAYSPVYKTKTYACKKK